MRVFEHKGLYWRVEVDGETIGTILSSSGAGGVFRAQLGPYPIAEDLGTFESLEEAEFAVESRWRAAMDKLIEVLRHNPTCARFGDHEAECDCGVKS